MLYDTILQPSSMILVATGINQPNSTYSYWLRVDPLLRAWSSPPSLKRFSMRYVTSHTLYSSGSIRLLYLITASLARALDLTCMLTNVAKGTDQSMDEYLQHNKTLFDSFAAIRSSMSDFELIQFTTCSLPLDYHTFVITYSMLPSSHIFNKLRSKLIFYEQ